MEIGTKNYTDFEQEVEVGDIVNVEGYKAEVLEITEPNKIKLKYSKTEGNERIETWDKDCVHHFDKKEV